ncbi:hypothetical protein [Emticicia fontis]
MKKKLLIALLLLFNLACGKNEPVILVYEIDPQFLPHVTEFIKEAEKVGIIIKPENLRMTFKTDLAKVCGDFTADKTGQRNIVINTRCWKTAPVQNREALVFHELGHCFLNRAHRDELTLSKEPVSIMYTYNQGPYEPCIYPINGDNSCNKTSRRDYYIKELFNEKTPVPFWGN